jgi:hypothetical protein
MGSHKRKIINTAETCCHIRNYIKSVVLYGYCCTIYCDILQHNGMEKIKFKATVGGPG